MSNNAMPIGLKAKFNAQNNNFYNDTSLHDECLGVATQHVQF